MGAFLGTQVALDTAAGAGRLDDLEPVAIGVARRIGDDLHDVAVLERRAQRHEAAVDLGPGAMMAHLAVDVEGEVQRRGAFGQFLHVTGRGVDVDLVLEQVQLERMHELARVRFVALALEDLAQPGELFQVLGVDPALFLVQPVRGHTVFGLPVHLFGTDLDLDALAFGPDDRGMQALVAVGLGHGDIVLEAPVHRLPLRVHQTEHRVTVADVLDQHAEGHDVVHLVQGQGLGLHLFVDAVLVLDAPVDLPFQTVGSQQILDEGDHLFDDLLFHHLMRVQPVVDLVVDVRPQVFEAQVLQLALEQVQAQTVGQGRVDVHGLLGDAALLVGLLEIKGAHVVQAVGQFDHQHAHVVAHGQDHLADVLGLRLFLVLEDDHADLGDTVHDVGHVFTELVVDLFDGGAGVFHRIVQQARRHRGLVKAHVGQGIGHGQRMGQIGLARKARLPRVSCGGEHIGLLDQLQIGIMVVGRHLVENFLNTNHSVLPDGKKLTIPVLSMFGQLSRLVNDDGPEGRDRRRKLPPARGGPMQASG